MTGKNCQKESGRLAVGFTVGRHGHSVKLPERIWREACHAKNSIAGEKDCCKCSKNHFATILLACFLFILGDGHILRKKENVCNPDGLVLLFDNSFFEFYKSLFIFLWEKVKYSEGKDDNKYSKIIQRRGDVKMRIVRTEKIQGVYGNQSLKRAEVKTGVSYGKDSVIFSNFAREMQLASKAVREAPEVRAEKVEQLKAQLEAGKYNVSASQIADKILGF